MVVGRECYRLRRLQLGEAFDVATLDLAKWVMLTKGPFRRLGLNEVAVLHAGLGLRGAPGQACRQQCRHAKNTSVAHHSTSIAAGIAPESGAVEIGSARASSCWRRMV